MSVSQFAELVGIEPRQFLDVEVNRVTSTVTLVLEPEADMQGTGTFPQIHGNTAYGSKSGSAKTPKGGGPKKQ